MRAVIYARFSSDNQRQESITAQVRACTEYAQRNGYTVVKVYADEAKSATTDDRPGFLEMIEDTKTGRVKVKRGAGAQAGPVCPQPLRQRGL
ncbi:recombinase family protein [Desulfallas sp. Bu1-1]|uniref:recombinase family protein n=1 Tax=Desulfallas sp. Bu1-1 TaxID=2787620 RepID=UPI001FAD9DB5|nr:recombinase family protein [Desulfallas sp. Bu1-1]